MACQDQFTLNLCEVGGAGRDLYLFIIAVEAASGRSIAVIKSETRYIDLRRAIDDDC